MPNSDPAGNGWHLDKRVPLALIVTIFIQTVGVVWWASALTARVTAIETWVANRPVHIPADTGERLVTVEGNQRHISATLIRIEGLLNRLDDRMRSREASGEK